jgi:S-DNA-T family DNA segregation ATPase FtsK/SpoIIIE
MLFLHPREPQPIRIHGAFITTEEVKRVVNYIRHQPSGDPWRLPAYGQKGSGETGLTDGQMDDYFWKAAELVVRHQQGSASLLQRRLRIGYARAGRLIDELEDAGVIGPPEGAKAREVLMDEEQLTALYNAMNFEEGGDGNEVNP